MFRSFLRWLLLSLLTVWGQSAVADTRTYYVHTDHLGTPHTLTDRHQRVVWRADYEPFGRIDPAIEEVEFEPRFPGQYFDRETGLHYNGFRYYDPATGRYISSDPIGLAGGINTYGYAHQNPLAHVDPSGLAVFCLQSANVAGLQCRDDPDDPNAVELTVEDAGVALATTAASAALAVGRTLAAGGRALAGKACAPAAKGIAPAKRASRQTVLGSYPHYVKLSDQLGARRFEISMDVWNRMSPAERWGANQRFLDRMISRGDEVILSNPVSSAQRGTSFFREIEYLKNQGYRPSDDGLRMLPGN